MKKTLQIQTALFFKENFSRSFEEISLKIKNVIAGEPVTMQLPVPPNAPPEVPRLILNYEGKIAINVAKNRIDFFYSNFSNEKDTIIKIFNEITNLGLIIGRVGFVKNIFLDDNNIEDIKKYLVEDKSNKLLNLKEISIRVNTFKKIGEFECNNIQNIANGKINSNGVIEDGVLVVRDINTSVESITVNEVTNEKLSIILDDFNNETELFII
ncbi:MAG: hypothetical protein Q7S04_01365 [Candidatus Moranbacteria bacterium]|nr:hypothetical protein [Candidatus Moranbacteria bacterium]